MRLPPELLRIVFHHLDGAVEMASSAAVCSDWHRATLDEGLWRHHFARKFGCVVDQPRGRWPSAPHKAWVSEFKHHKFKEAQVEWRRLLCEEAETKRLKDQAAGEVEWLRPMVGQCKLLGG